MKKIEINIFVSAFILAFLGLGFSQSFPAPFTYAISLFAIFYLFAGWYFLPVKAGTKGRWLSFFISFLIAQTLVAVIFAINDWPLRKMLGYYTFFLVAVSLLVLLGYRQTTNPKAPINEFIARLVVCLLFASAPIWLLH